MKPYGWKPRANEYVGGGVERLERVVSKAVARRGAVICTECKGDGEVASLRVDEDGDECPPVGCGRCGGTGVDPLRVVK